MAGGTGSDVTPGSVTFDQILSYLKSKDDTRRFVGLSLLHTLINERDDFRKDPTAAERAWAAIPAPFLNKLLRAEADDRRAPEEANNMVSLAVSVIHTFCVLLSPEVVQQSKMLSLVEGLVKSLVDSDMIIATLALQAITSITFDSKGANQILDTQDLSPIIRTLPIQDTPLNLLPQLALHADFNADRSTRLNDLIAGALKRYSRMDSTPVFVCISNILSKNPTLDAEGFSWVPQAFDAVRETMLEHPTRPTIEASSKLISVLAGNGVDFPFFGLDGADEDRTESGKPFSYFFIDLILADIRAAIPSLLEILKTDPLEYRNAIERLTSELVVISAAVHALMSSLDDDDDVDDGSERKLKLNLDPSDLLNVRKDLNETMSLLLEFVRDRWDSAIDVPIEDGDVLLFKDDPITLFMLQPLAILLSEDSNQQLIRETTSIMDILLEVYQTHSEADIKRGHEGQVVVILISLVSATLGDEDANNEMSTTSTESPVDQFLDQGGWKIISNQLLKDALHDPGDIEALDAMAAFRVPGLTQHLALLSAVVNNPAVHQSKAQWISTMDKLLASFSEPTQPTAYHDEIFTARLWSLVLDILEKAPTSIQKQRKNSVQKALSRAMKDAGVVSMMDDEDEDDYEPDSLGAVLQELEMLLLSFSPPAR